MSLAVAGWGWRTVEAESPLPERRTQFPMHVSRRCDLPSGRSLFEQAHPRAQLAPT